MSTPFSFGGGLYELVVPADNQRVPRPRPGTTGAWVHVPYATGNLWETDGGRRETSWSPPGGIVIPDAASYAIFEALYDRWGLLVFPWGTVNARLDTLDLTPYEDGSYMGSVQWSWA